MEKEEIRLCEKLADIYESIIAGFIIELVNQNVDGRDIGKSLAKIIEIMENYNA